MTNDESVAAQWTVNEAIRRCPRSVAVFSRFGVDACCGGSVPIGEAAERHGADKDALLAELMLIMQQDA